MSGSGGIRGIRQVKRKKSSLSEVKMAVLGAPGVGKSGKDDISNRRETCVIFSPIFFRWGGWQNCSTLKTLWTSCVSLGTVHYCTCTCTVHLQTHQKSCTVLTNIARRKYMYLGEFAVLAKVVSAQQKSRRRVNYNMSCQLPFYFLSKLKQLFSRFLKENLSPLYLKRKTRKIKT